MKHITIIIASILFSTLFYNQKIGVNLSIFSIISILILLVSNTQKFRNKTTIIYTLLYLLTAALVFIQHTSLSILANVLAFITLVGSVKESKSSIYVQWYNGIYTSVAGYIHRNLYKINNDDKETIKKDIDVLHLVKLVGIPLAFITVFIVLYRNGNPIFSDLISKIDLSFINLKWILFTVLGYYLFSNIFSPVQVDLATNKDLQTGNILKQNQPFSTEILVKEKQLGTTLLLLLNILIVFYLTTDIISLNTKWTEAHVLSSQVHNGINALIASIVIAIVIILYFFRGNLNFYEHNKILKNLAFTWIILNTILVILIAAKNYNYITAFGLTYKRIGVNVYLFLTLIGLITTFLKVSKVKNLWFLFRINTQIAFVLLMILSVVNWDNSITKYNINHAQSLDLNYLINLSDNNAVLLNEYRKSNNLSSNLSNRIITKHRNFVYKLNSRNWQEYTYSNFELKTIPKTSRNNEYFK